MATMRALQNLNISLGMFGFPVKVYKGTDDPTDGIGFRQIHAACKTPINQVKRCVTCNVDVPTSELLKGYETNGAMLAFTDEEVKALKPEAAGTIKIDGYLSPEAVDPCYQGGYVYYLAPDRGDKQKADADTFATWRDALKGRWAVGKVVMYGREHVVAIRAVDRMLAMHFLRTHAEIRSLADVPGYNNIPETSKPEYAELMAQLVDAKAIRFDDVAIEQDSYVTAVKALIQSRVDGTAAPTPAAAGPATSGSDLMAMLKASVAAMSKEAV